MAAPVSLRTSRSFRLLWTSQVASVAAMAFSDVVLPILLYQLTGSALQTALVLALRVGPYLVFGLVAGAVADRVDRRRLMVGCDLLNAAVLASVPLAGAFGVLSVAQLYAVAAVSATAWVWSDAAFFGALPAVVGRGGLVAANSALYSARMVVDTVAPSAAGVLVAQLGAATTFSVNTAFYVLSAATILMIRQALQHHHEADDRLGSGDTLRRRLARDINEGLRFIWDHPLIRPLTLLGAGLSVSVGAVWALLVPYGVEALGLTDDDPGLGLLFGVGGAGALVATLALPRLAARYGVPRITLLGLTATLALTLAIVAAPTLAIALPLVGAWGGTSLLVIVNGITLRQQVTPDALQSRVNASARLIALSGNPLGALLAGIVAQAANVRIALLVGAVGVAASTVLGWLSPLRRMGPEPPDVLR
jgi:MFS family permease